MNSDKIYKIAKIGAGVLGLIGIIMLVRVMIPGDEELKSSLEVQASVLDPFISFTIFMLYLTALLAIGFSIWNLIIHPAQLKKALLSLAVLGLVFLAAYVFASDAEVTGPNGVSLEGGAAGSTPKMVGALINYTYFLGIIALACVVWGSVRGMFSNK